jgi:hypothetical protein
LIFFACLSNLQAQKRVEGIYIQAGDVVDHNYFSRTGIKPSRIKTNTIFFRSYVQIWEGDSMYRLAKDSIYGYCDKNGVSFRFYKKGVYEIVNPAEPIPLYRVRSYVQAKGSLVEEKYFFSANRQAPIQELTRSNLKRSFKENKLFYEWLDNGLINAPLWAYDTACKMTVLNRMWAHLSQYK